MANSTEITATQMQVRRLDYATDPLAPQAADLIYRSVLYALNPGVDPVAEYQYAFGSFDNFCAVDQTGRLLGVAALDTSRGQTHTARIENVAVTPHERGRGVGRALIHWVEAEAKQAGVEHLQVQSLRQAIGFYEKLGYVARVRQIPDLLVKQLPTDV